MKKLLSLPLITLSLLGCSLFVPVHFSLNIEISGHGSVTKEPEGESYKKGTTVTLTAIPDFECTFDHWEEDLTGSENPVTIKMDNDKNIKVVFKENARQYTLEGLWRSTNQNDTFSLVRVPPQGFQVLPQKKKLISNNFKSFFTGFSFYFFQNFFKHR